MTNTSDEQRGDPQQPGTQAMRPGDEVPPGTPGSGENVCPDCGGTGLRDGNECVTCGGTGVVTEAVGGA
jgi:DnaJ-class molecular chaperone